LAEFRVAPADRARGAEMLRPFREQLETGRGFAILDRIPMERVTPSDAHAMYWVVGQFLGEPMEQNVQGTVIYACRDAGQDVAYGAGFAVTNAESSFHTDNSFGDKVLDYVGLLCLNTAVRGGLNQNVSGLAALEELSRTDPEALETLSRPFHVDRRGGVNP